MKEAIDSLYARLVGEYSEERMKGISAELIEAYKQGNLRVLNRYAGWLRLAPASSRAAAGKLFMKLIVHYHPDKRSHKLREMEELHRAGSLARLEEYARGIGADGYRAAEALAAAEAPPAAEDAPAGFYDHDDFEYEETYAYDEEWFDEDYADYPDGDIPVEEQETEEFGFIEAVRAELFGNTDRAVLPGDLLSLDGELVLAGLDIEDLTGIEYCLHLSSLDLSGNRIANVHPIAGLKGLRALDLSDNEISDADPLAALDGLETLDLSGNEIEDVRALVALTGLRYLNLVGNPIMDHEPLRLLRRRGTIVIV